MGRSQVLYNRTKGRYRQRGVPTVGGRGHGSDGGGGGDDGVTSTPDTSTPGRTRNSHAPGGSGGSGGKGHKKKKKGGPPPPPQPTIPYHSTTHPAPGATTGGGGGVGVGKALHRRPKVDESTLLLLADPSARTYYSKSATAIQDDDGYDPLFANTGGTTIDVASMAATLTESLSMAQRLQIPSAVAHHLLHPTAGVLLPLLEEEPIAPSSNKTANNHNNNNNNHRPPKLPTAAVAANPNDNHRNPSTSLTSSSSLIIPEIRSADDSSFSVAHARLKVGPDGQVEARPKPGPYPYPHAHHHIPTQNKYSNNDNDSNKEEEVVVTATAATATASPPQEPIHYDYKPTEGPSTEQHNRRQSSRRADSWDSAAEDESQEDRYLAVGGDDDDNDDDDDDDDGYTVSGDDVSGDDTFLYPTGASTLSGGAGGVPSSTMESSRRSQSQGTERSPVKNNKYKKTSTSSSTSTSNHRPLPIQTTDESALSPTHHTPKHANMATTPGSGAATTPGAVIPETESELDDWLDYAMKSKSGEHHPYQQQQQQQTAIPSAHLHHIPVDLMEGDDYDDYSNFTHPVPIIDTDDTMDSMSTMTRSKRPPATTFDSRGHAYDDDGSNQPMRPSHPPTPEGEATGKTDDLDAWLDSVIS